MKISIQWLTGAVLLGALAGSILMSAPPRDALAQPKRESQKFPQAPQLLGQAWLNAPGGKAPDLAARRGQVTVVQFWTFACSNCLANLPAYARLHQKFKARGVEIIGIHTPESDFERDPKNVARRVQQLGIRYPILLDDQGKNWRQWNQQYWPTIYLIDKQGRIRHTHIGELRGDEAQLVRHIETLLQETAA